LFPVLAGGLDTTTNLFASAVLHLSRDRELRRRVIEDPSIRKSITEEFLRYYSPAPGLARTVASEWAGLGYPTTRCAAAT
jgi:cytochrome P450